MGLAELLHPALHALPDVTLAVDPQSLRVLDVNRAREAFGHGRAGLGAMGLDALVALPRDELLRFVQAADAQPLDVGVRHGSGAVIHATASASHSAGAAAAPCVLVVIRESPEYARAIEEVDRIRGVLSGALEALERVSQHRRAAAAAPVLADDEAPTGATVPRLPELTLAQYVSLCVESDLSPGRVHEINERYGLLNEQARALLDRAFRDKLAADPALEAERTALHAKYLFWFTTQGRARHDGGAVAAHDLHAPPPPPENPTNAVRVGAFSPAMPLPHSGPFPRPAASPGAGGHRPLPPLAPLPPPVPPPHPPAAPQPTTTQPPITQPAEARGTLLAADGRGGAPVLPFKPAAVPELNVDQYATLGVELEVYADRRVEVLARYGIHSEAAWNACEEYWAAHLVGDMAIRQRWMKVASELRKKLVRP